MDSSKSLILLFAFCAPVLHFLGTYGRYRYFPTNPMETQTVLLLALWFMVNVVLTPLLTMKVTSSRLLWNIMVQFTNLGLHSVNFRMSLKFTGCIWILGIIWTLWLLDLLASLMVIVYEGHFVLVQVIVYSCLLAFSSGFGLFRVIKYGPQDRARQALGRNPTVLEPIGGSSRWPTSRMSITQNSTRWSVSRRSHIEHSTNRIAKFASSSRLFIVIPLTLSLICSLSVSPILWWIYPHSILVQPLLAWIFALGWTLCAIRSSFWMEMEIQHYAMGVSGGWI